MSFTPGNRPRCASSSSQTKTGGQSEITRRRIRLSRGSPAGIFAHCRRDCQDLRVYDMFFRDSYRNSPAVHCEYESHRVVWTLSFNLQTHQREETCACRCYIWQCIIVLDACGRRPRKLSVVKYICSNKAPSAIWGIESSTLRPRS